MWLLEKEGRDPERLMDEICEELGKGREELEFEVLEEKEGFLGLFGKRVKVRARLRGPSEEELIDFAREVAEGMARAISPEARAEAWREGEEIRVEVEGDGSGRLIGRRGETLEALEYLVSMAVSKRAKSKRVVRLDVEGYRRRRRESLERRARELAERVRRTGKKVALPPMKASERRIVHLALKDVEGVETRSEGTGELKRVFILPRRGVSRGTSE